MAEGPRHEPLLTRTDFTAVASTSIRVADVGARSRDDSRSILIDPEDVVEDMLVRKVVVTIEDEDVVASRFADHVDEVRKGSLAGGSRAKEAEARVTGSELSHDRGRRVGRGVIEQD